MKTTSVMIVEYNADLRTTLRNAFEDHGYMTWTFPAPEIAFSIFATVQPTVIILDLDLLGQDAYGLIKLCREQCPKSAIVVESQQANAKMMRDAMEQGAHVFLVKPFAIAPLFDMLGKKASVTNPVVISMEQAA